MVRLLINIPKPLKVKLDALKSQGTSAAGLIRYLLNQHFSQSAKKGR